MNRGILSELKEALRAAQTGADPANSSCTVEAVHREEMRLYILTWVCGPLERAIASIEPKRTKS